MWPKSNPLIAYCFLKISGFILKMHVVFAFQFTIHPCFSFYFIYLFFHVFPFNIRKMFFTSNLPVKLTLQENIYPWLPKSSRSIALDEPGFSQECHPFLLPAVLAPKDLASTIHQNDNSQGPGLVWHT